MEWEERILCLGHGLDNQDARHDPISGSALKNCSLGRSSGRDRLARLEAQTRSTRGTGDGAEPADIRYEQEPAPFGRPAVP
jgi:hypothetical protein